MRKLLLLPALAWSATTFAQAPNCTAVKAENEALKEKIIAYEARLGIGAGGVSVADGDDKVKVKFLSCKASRSTHKAVFAFLVTNSDEPTEIRVFGKDYNPSTIFDEAGQGYAVYSPQVGASSGHSALIPTGTPVKCTLPFEDVPLSATRLNTVVLSLRKQTPGMSKEIQFKTTLRNMPITWVP